MSPDRPISTEQVAVLLSAALGKDKSHELVSTAARAVGISSSTFTGEEARAIVAALTRVEGLVGVVARFAVSRGDVDKLLGRASPRIDPPSTARSDVRVDTRSTSTSSPAAAASVDLIPLLAPALGAQKAGEAIAAAAVLCGVESATGLSRAGALAVLHEMERVEGIVGVVARFARERLLLLP